MARMRLRRQRSALTLFALAIAVVMTSTFWLAESGTLSLPQATAVVGPGPGGSTTTFTVLTPSTVSIPQGQGAQVVSGMVLGKIMTVSGYAPKAKIDIAWINPRDAGAVFNNPNVWITFGLYYPIHTGVCISGDGSGVQTITDSVTLCGKLITTATGDLIYNGELTINSTDHLNGFMIGTFQDQVTPATCIATGATWCAPSGLAASRNIFYVVAAINTPGGIPPGQQSALTAINFYFNVRSS